MKPPGVGGTQAEIIGAGGGDQAECAQACIATTAVAAVGVDCVETLLAADLSTACLAPARPVMLLDRGSDGGVVPASPKLGSGFAGGHTFNTPSVGDLPRPPERCAVKEGSVRVLAGAHLLRPTEGDDSEWRKSRIRMIEKALSAGVDWLEFVERGLAAQLRDELQQLQAGQCGRMFRWAEAVVGKVPEREPTTQQLDVVDGRLGLTSVNGIARVAGTQAVAAFPLKGKLKSTRVAGSTGVSWADAEDSGSGGNNSSAGCDLRAPRADVEAQAVPMAVVDGVNITAAGIGGAVRNRKGKRSKATGVG